MRINDAKKLLTEIVLDNLVMFEKGIPPSQFTVPFFTGDPGVGKTAIPKQVAAEQEIPYFQTIVAQFDPGELAGLPFMGEVPIKRVGEDGKLHDAMETRMIRLRPSYLPDINDANQHIGIYNLDELPQAMLAGQNVMSQLTNEWRIGEHRISPGITICCTGNNPGNKAGTTAMPMHLRDRLMFINIEAHIDDFLSYAAQTNPATGEARIDKKIRAFLRQYSQHLHKFELGANAYRSPRSWEKVSNILRWNIPQESRSEAILGQVGSVAIEFEQWLRVEGRMPDPDKIIADPENAPVFDNKDADILYLLLASLSDKAKKSNIGAILKYLDRLPNKEFVAYFAQDAMARDPSLSDTKEYTNWAMTQGVKLLC